MKISIIFIAITVFGTAALSGPIIKGNSSEQVARKIVTALKKSSPEAYAALFPALEEFYQIMDENATVYGEHLNAAKKEFATRYENEVLPALKESFASVIRAGKEKGIDWNAIRYERIEYSNPEEKLLSAPFTVVFSSKGREHKFQIENAFILHDEWRVGQSIRLI
jgi:hypothetical protein